MASLQTVIAGPTTVNPTADYTQETVASGPTVNVIHLFNHGQYLLRVVTSPCWANAAPTTPGAVNLAY